MSFLSNHFGNRTKLLALCLAWTVCLSLATLNIQHSCDPIIGAPPTGCSKIVASGDSDSQVRDGDLQLEVTKEAKSVSETSAVLPTKATDINPNPGNAQATEQPQGSKNLFPVAIGAGGGAIAGAGASALVGAEMVAATLPLVGGAVIATPVAVTVATGMVLFLVVRSLMGGT